MQHPIKRPEDIIIAHPFQPVGNTHLGNPHGLGGARGARGEQNIRALRVAGRGNPCSPRHLPVRGINGGNASGGVIHHGVSYRGERDHSSSVTRCHHVGLTVRGQVRVDGTPGNPQAGGRRHRQEKLLAALQMHRHHMARPQPQVAQHCNPIINRGPHLRPRAPRKRAPRALAATDLAVVPYAQRQDIHGSPCSIELDELRQASSGQLMCCVICCRNLCQLCRRGNRNTIKISLLSDFSNQVGQPVCMSMHIEPQITSPGHDDDFQTAIRQRLEHQFTIIDGAYGDRRQAGNCRSELKLGRKRANIHVRTNHMPVGIGHPQDLA